MFKWLKSTNYITFEIADRVAHIRLNRPEKRNALSPDLIGELHDALLEADDRVDVNVVVLSGSGPDFCAGYDIMEAYVARQNKNGGDRYRTQSATFDDDCWTLERNMHKLLAIANIHKPVIAKVHGNCLAGGVDLALMCDIVIAADNAKIGNPANRTMGSPPLNMWYYNVGPQWAKRLLMTGDTILGHDAAKIGLVMDAVPAEQLDKEVDLLASRMSYVDAELLSAQKRIVNIAMELAGAQTLQRLATEMDARAHMSTGPRRAQYKSDLATHGLKLALKNRDAPFGDGIVKLFSRGT